MITLAVDAIMVKDEKLLMIVRGGSTFHDFLALPGGMVEEGETVEEAVIREIKEECGVDAVPLEILGVYSEPGRDPRGHTCSVVFVMDFKGTPEAGDDAKDFRWIALPPDESERIAFDHRKVIGDYLVWRERRGTYWSGKTTRFGH
ncbi:MAG: NUDIX hydrolase [Spirochaetales bacterium]|nr:NUDIX hydrolase [Spirochaetales bacterium]